MSELIYSYVKKFFESTNIALKKINGFYHSKFSSFVVSVTNYFVITYPIILQVEFDNMKIPSPWVLLL